MRSCKLFFMFGIPSREEYQIIFIACIPAMVCATFSRCVIFIIEISLKFSSPGRVMENKHICCSSLAMHQNSSADVTPGVEKTMRLGRHPFGRRFL